MEKFKLAVVGGRDFTDYPRLVAQLDYLLATKAHTHEVVIVCGLAKGADTLGDRYAKERGLKVEYHKAAWSDIKAPGAVIKENSHGLYNARAGMDRNKSMADSCTAAVAFWDGVSSGTEDMIGTLRCLGKRVVVYNY